MPKEYQAGKCNIGEQEIKYRKQIVGYGGGVVSLALYTMLVFFNMPIWLYAILIVPVFTAVHGLNEAKYAFCTNYARTGRYNMASEQGMTQDVLSGSKRRLDRQYANKLTQKSLVTAFFISIVLIGASRFIN
jgi:hypothetical protein